MKKTTLKQAIQKIRQNELETAQALFNKNKQALAENGIQFSSDAEAKEIIKKRLTELTFAEYPDVKFICLDHNTPEAKILFNYKITLK